MHTTNNTEEEAGSGRDGPINVAHLSILSNHSVVLVRPLRFILAPKVTLQLVPFSTAKAAVMDKNGGQRLHALHQLLEI